MRNERLAKIREHARRVPMLVCSDKEVESTVAFAPAIVKKLPESMDINEVIEKLQQRDYSRNLKQWRN